MWAAAAAIIAAIIAAGTSMYAASEASKRQSEWYEYNAALARKKAEDTEAAAQANAERQRMENERLRERQRLAFAASGTTMEGSPTDFLADTATLQELDIDTYLHNQRLQAGVYSDQANLDLMGGSNALAAGRNQSGQALLSGVGTAANIYGNYQYRQEQLKLNTKPEYTYGE